MTERSEEEVAEMAELSDRGFERLREGDLEGALADARRLEELRHAAAYDIGGQALDRLGRRKEAIEMLERGLANAPECWLNWQLLGNLSSDDGNYDGAAEAYERALACEGADRDSIAFNRAVVAGRVGDYARVLELLEPIKEPWLILEGTSHRVTALDQTGRTDEALFLADRCLNEGWPDDEGNDALAYVAARQGRIRLANGWEPEDVRGAAVESTETYGHRLPLIQLVYDIDGGEVFGFVYHAIPTASNSDVDEAGGAYVRCFLAGCEDEKTADERARAWLAEEHWRVVERLASFEVDPYAYDHRDDSLYLLSEAVCDRTGSFELDVYDREVPFEVAEAFFSGRRTDDVPFAIDDRVEIVSGPHAGRAGRLCSIESSAPEVVLEVDVGDDEDQLSVPVDGLRHAPSDG